MFRNGDVHRLVDRCQFCHWLVKCQVKQLDFSENIIEVVRARREAYFCKNFGVVSEDGVNLKPGDFFQRVCFILKCKIAFVDNFESAARFFKSKNQKLLKLPHYILRF